MWLTGPPGDRDQLTAWHDGFESRYVDDLDRELDVGCQSLSQVLQRIRISSPRAKDLSPEPDRMRDRVEALQNDQSRHAPGAVNRCELHSEPPRLLHVAIDTHSPPVKQTGARLRDSVRRTRRLQAMVVDGRDARSTQPPRDALAAMPCQPSLPLQHRDERVNCTRAIFTMSHQDRINVIAIMPRTANRVSSPAEYWTTYAG